MKNIICNRCGIELKMKNDIVYEDYLCIQKKWGFFSEKDGMTQEFILCEKCVERMEKDFLIPSKWYETTELL